MDPNTIISDVKSLWESAKEDYHAQRFEAYPNYIIDYNRLLENAKEFGITDLEPLTDVSEGEKGTWGMRGTVAEKAKLREIVMFSERLCQRLISIFGTIKNNEKNDMVILENIFSKFHKVERQLRSRHSNRNTLVIEDEYDVQDLLHSLLRLFFDDIRPEEWTPSYAGGSSRMDFLIKNEQIVIEVKKTRNGLGQREVGDELLIDIGKYSEHPDCKTLICFVYDPEGRIGNPTGLENDLNAKSNDKMKVVLFIRPK